MKLASIKSDSRDGTLIVVSRDLTQAVEVPALPPACRPPSKTGRTRPRNWKRSTPN